MFVKCYSMIKIKTKEQIEIMYESVQVVSRTLGMLAREIKPGVTTLYLDKLAEEYIRSQDAKPGFLGLYGCGALKNGYYGDHAYTFAVGEVSPEVAQLLKVTKESLYIGIREFRLGNRVEDVGYAIQTYCEKHGYGVVRELVGHGVGTKMHEDPEMPNYGRRGRGKKFVEGMVVAIEPMINMGTKNINQLRDGWTILTRDGKPSAHFEHDVALVDGKPKLLSTFKYIYEALGIESHEEDEFLYK